MREQLADSRDSAMTRRIESPQEIDARGGWTFFAINDCPISPCFHQLVAFLQRKNGDARRPRHRRSRCCRLAGQFQLLHYSGADRWPGGSRMPSGSDTEFNGPDRNADIVDHSNGSVICGSWNPRFETAAYMAIKKLSTASQQAQQ
jgi:hypothetical protein